MMGITNCAANFMSMLAPLMVGFILDDAVSYFFVSQLPHFFILLKYFDGIFLIF